MIKWVATQVYDPRVRKWRVVILAIDEQGSVSTHMPIDAWKTEDEARLNAYSVMIIFQKKAQQHA